MKFIVQVAYWQFVDVTLKFVYRKKNAQNFQNVVNRR